jgi:hypothetical protein
MTLLSMYKRDDSRNVYKILADQAVKYIDHPTGGSEARILFANLARLLERYRYDAFFSHGAPGILEVFSREHRTLHADKVESTPKTLDVIPALQKAHEHVYKALSKDDLVKKLQELLVTLSNIQTSVEVDTDSEIKNARLFFVTLAEKLNERRT